MRILMLGDSPFVGTGFGTVNAIAYDALLRAGHDLIVLGGQDGEARDVPDNVKFVPVEGGTSDMLGWTKVVEVIKTHRPDAVNIVGDPAMVAVWLLHSEVSDLPGFAYMPVEGAPFNLIWEKALKDAKNLTVATCTNFGVRTLRDIGIEAKFAYHGVSDDFYRYDKAKRDEWRWKLDWHDKFVVMCVAQNVRRKQWPRLFQAVALLKKRIPNLILYAHTMPFNNYWLDGHDLTQVAMNLDIYDRVYFPPSHSKHNAAVPLHGTDKPGLVDMYNVADCFVLPSQVEGFGLPLAEAMKCGLPVITTDYAASAEVVGTAGQLIYPHDWEINKASALYANLDPSDIASAIERLYKSDELREKYSRKGIERAAHYTWDDYRSLLKEFFDGTVVAPAETKEAAEVDLFLAKGR